MNKEYAINRDMTVTPVKRNNKTIGLSYEENTTPKRQERYSLGLDVALPTPKKFQFQPERRDAGTSPRGVGSPPAAAYRNANPSRVSVGEMTNPAQL